MSLEASVFKGNRLFRIVAIQMRLRVCLALREIGVEQENLNQSLLKTHEQYGTHI